MRIVKQHNQRRNILRNSVSCADCWKFLVKETKCVLEYYWQLTEWSDCNSNCGTGTHNRTVSCMSSKKNSIVSEKNCNIQTMPTTLQECRSNICPGKHIYHAVLFTDYDLCTKFVVSCHSNFNFPWLVFYLTDLHDIYGDREGVWYFLTPQKG